MYRRIVFDSRRLNAGMRIGVCAGALRATRIIEPVVGTNKPRGRQLIFLAYEISNL